MPEKFFRFGNPYTGTVAGSGDGSSMANASSNLTDFGSFIGASSSLGNVIWVNSDAYLPVPITGGYGLTLYNRRPSTGTLIRSYDVGSALSKRNSHVMLDAFIYSAQDALGGSWAHQGDGVWARTFSVTSSCQFRSVWACDGEVRGQFGNTRWELCRRASQAACTVEGDWWASTSNSTTPTLYIQTGRTDAGGDPDSVFGGICATLYNAGRHYAAEFAASSRISFERWMTLGGGIAFSPLSSNACEDMTFLNLRQECIGEIVALGMTNHRDGGSATTAPLRRLHFDDYVLRRRSQGSLWKRVDTEAFTGLDHVTIMGYVDGIRFRDPDVDSRGCHGEFSVYANTENASAGTFGDNTWPRNIEVYGSSRTKRGRIQGPSGTDAHLCYGRLINCQTEGMVTWRNLDILDNNIQGQFSGRMRMEGCYLRSSAVAYAGYDNGGNNNKGALHCAFFGKSALLSTIGCVDIDVRDTVFEMRHNSYCVSLNQDSVTPINDYAALRFTHCSFIDVVAPTGKNGRISGAGDVVPGGSAPIQRLRWLTSDAGLNGTFPQFQDCVAITPTGNFMTLLQWTSSFAYTEHAASALATYNAASRNNVVLASLADAGMADYKTLTAASPLRGVGAYGVGSVDINGRLRSLPNTVGAAEAA